MGSQKLQLNILTVLPFFLFCSSLAAMEPGQNGNLSDDEPTVTDEESDILEEAQTLATDDPEQAITFLSPKIRSSSSPALDFALGQCHSQNNQPGKAIEAFKDALRKKSDFHRARFHLARQFIQQDRIDDAAEQLLRLIKDDPRHRARNWRLLGHCRSTEGHDETAELAFRYSLLYDPDSRQAALGLIQSLVRQDRLEDSKSLVRKQLHKNPRDEKLWSVLLNTELEQKDHLAGLTILESMSRMGITDEKQELLLGKLYLQEKLPDSAVKVYQRLLDDSENTPLADILQGVEALIRTNNLREADELLQEIEQMEIKSDEAAKHETKRLSANIAFKREEYSRALDKYRELLRERPLEGELLMQIGECYRRQDKLAQARDFFRRAARREDYKAQALMREGMAAAEQERYDEAVKLLRSSLAEKNDPRVQRYLEQLQKIRQSLTDENRNSLNSGTP